MKPEQSWPPGVELVGGEDDADANGPLAEPRLRNLLLAAVCVLYNTAIGACYGFFIIGAYMGRDLSNDLHIYIQLTLGCCVQYGAIGLIFCSPAAVIVTFLKPRPYLWGTIGALVPLTVYVCMLYIDGRGQFGMQVPLSSLLYLLMRIGILCCLLGLTFANLAKDVNSKRPKLPLVAWSRK